MSDLQLLACEPREARSTRSILRHARGSRRWRCSRSLWPPSRSNEYTYTVRSRERSCRSDGIAKGPMRRSDDDRSPERVYRTQPRTRLERARGKIDATQLDDRRGAGCERGGLWAQYIAAAGRYGDGYEQRTCYERRCRAGRLAADQPHTRRESLFTVDRHQRGQREKS